MGDEGKAVGCVPPTALLFVEPRPAYIRHRRSPPTWSAEEQEACFRKTEASLEFCCDAADRARQTFTLSSFLKDENSVSEWPGARGHHEEPLSHCPRRGCACGRQHAGGHEQRLQEQPTCVVRSDVHAPHKNWLSLAVNLVPPIGRTTRRH